MPEGTLRCPPVHVTGTLCMWTPTDVMVRHYWVPGKSAITGLQSAGRRFFQAGLPERRGEVINDS